MWEQRQYTKNCLAGPVLWEHLKYYKLDRVMRQRNALFSGILNKIGDGEIITASEKKFIEDRFHSANDASVLCPYGIRLYYSNADVHAHNARKLSEATQAIVSIAKQEITGCNNADEVA